MHFYQQVTQSNYLEIVKSLNRIALKNNINPVITHDIVIVWEDNDLIGKLYVSKELLNLV